ncbi:hypothetical protein WG66_013300 [Moniliophthora roreri]|nr:hypothetical protein WG66_013300 [Moniliophthora roreri]
MTGTADALHCAFIIVFLYDAVIKHFDDATFLVTTNWVYSTGHDQQHGADVLWMASQASDRKLDSSRYHPVLLCGSFPYGHSMVEFFTEFHKFKAVVIIWLVCAALADMIITVTLVIFLRRHKTGFKHTDSRIDRIIRCKFLLALASALAKPSSPSDRSDWPYYRHLCGDGSIVVPIIPHWSAPHIQLRPSKAVHQFTPLFPEFPREMEVQSNPRFTHETLARSPIFRESFGERHTAVLIHVESQETVDHTGRRDQSTSADENRV